MALTRLLDVARWLRDEDFPAVRVLDVGQPLHLGVTFWQSLGDDVPFSPVEEFGHLLRRLHRLAPPSSLALPGLDPFELSSRRLDVVPLPEEQCAFLRSRLREVREAYAALHFELPFGPVHGDASNGNVLISRDGVPTLIDLDGFVTGPREWDLVLTAMFADRLGWHTAAEYEAFVAAYGHDVLAWPGYGVLADAQELQMVTWIAQRADESPVVAAEVAARIHSLRAGSTRTTWRAYY